MSHSSDLEEELSEISDSEIADHAEKVYFQLQSKHYKVKKSGAYKCPFCPSKKKQRYQYVDLLQHATGISVSNKHQPKMKAQHQALAKYIKHDLKDPKLSHQVVAVDPAPTHKKDEEKYVWPWKGILVNLPVKFRGDKYVGKTAEEIMEMISQFNPLDVFPLWDDKGHTGRCIVDFGDDWNGYCNAISFNKHYNSKGLSRLRWQQRDKKSKEVHGWIAMETDFNQSGLVGDHLRQHGVLRSVDDVVREKDGSRVSDLTVQIEAKNQDIYEMEWKYNASAISLAQVMDDRERLSQSFNEELSKMEKEFCVYHQSVLEQTEKMRVELEYKRRQLDERNRQLSIESSQYEINKQELDNEKQKRAEIEQQKANEELLALIEKHKREKEENLKKSLQLQKELAAKQLLKEEIEKLEGLIEVRHHMREDGGGTSAGLKKLEILKEELEDKKDDLEAMDAMNKTLLERKNKARDEIQEARKELIQELQKILGPRTAIVLKNMGELSLKVVKKSAPPGANADKWAATCCSKLEGELKNPEWCPFKKDIGPQGEEEVVVVDDEKLVEVRNTYGEEVCEAVRTALLELNEYNPEGRCPVKEIWKAKEDRKATLKEVIQYVSKQLKTLKSRKSRWQM